MIDRCVVCGEVIPESRQVCPKREDSHMRGEMYE